MRYALRNLARTPCSALPAILPAALGIGLATAVFPVAEALLLRRLPVRDQDRLVVLWGQASDRTYNYPFGPDDAREFARHTRSLERVAFFSYYGAGPKPIRDGDQISPLRRALVSGEFFDVLGARPPLGRALRADHGVELTCHQRAAERRGLRSAGHTAELPPRLQLVCRPLLGR